MLLLIVLEEKEAATAFHGWQVKMDKENELAL